MNWSCLTGTLRLPRGRVRTLLLAVAALTLVLPRGNTAAGPPADQADSTTVGNADPNDKPFEFRLSVVGPSGNPVPDANVELRTSPLLTADQLIRGKFLRTSNYGVFARTDDQGRLTVTLPEAPQRFNASIKQPGYGPYWAGWSNRSHPEQIPREFTAELEEGGRFAFERVFPGEGRIGRRIMLMVDDGATEVTSSQRVATEFTSGETTELDLGGTGRAVLGKLAPPVDTPERVLWNFALVNVRVAFTPLPEPEVPEEIEDDPAQRAVWWATIGQSWKAAQAADQKLRSKSPSFTATVDRDGSFRIDDMPPGTYILGVRFNDHAAGVLSSHRFSVPPVEEGQPADPVDLGLLRLQKP